MSQYPEPVVGAFIFNTEGKLFLMKSHKWHDMYVVPGGHIELGEHIEEAVKREAKEETGLDVSEPEFICVWEFINEDEFWKKKHMLFLNYKVKTVSENVQLNNEAQSFVWVSPEESLTLPLQKHTKMTIEEYLLSNL